MRSAHLKYLKLQYMLGSQIKYYLSFTVLKLFVCKLDIDFHFGCNSIWYALKGARPQRAT